MHTVTARLSNVISYSDPRIFQSTGDNKSFSSVIGKIENVVVGAEFRNTLAMPFEFFYTFPDQERTPKHAIYDFSLSVSKIGDVKAVSYQIEDNIMLVWTFINKRDPKVRRLIYEKEMQLMNDYPELIFDFNVASIQNSSETFIPDGVRGSLSFFRNF